MVVTRGRLKSDEIVDHAVSKPESSSEESLADCRVNACVVSLEKGTFGEGSELKLVHDVITENQWQVLCVCDVLEHGAHYFSGFLEEPFIVPIRIQLRQLSGESVVFTKPERVLSNKWSLLIYSTIPLKRHHLHDNCKEHNQEIL